MKRLLRSCLLALLIAFSTSVCAKSLSEAIDQVRNQTRGKILSAKTVVRGDREVHVIKVLTEDGRVKTFRVDGNKVRGEASDETATGRR